MVFINYCHKPYQVDHLFLIFNSISKHIDGIGRKEKNVSRETFFFFCIYSFYGVKGVCLSNMFFVIFWCNIKCYHNLFYKAESQVDGYIIVLHSFKI